MGRAAIVVSKEGNSTLVTDAILHGEPINSYAWLTWIHDFIPVPNDLNRFADVLDHILSDNKSKRVGVVGFDNIPIMIWERLKNVHEIEWVNLWLEFLTMKSIRSDLEINLQREIGAITALAMKVAIESISSGMTENEIAATAYRVMFERGAHDRSFQTIVNSRSRGGLKHSYPTARKIQTGDMIYLDMGAMKFGYQIDMSRSVVLGGANNEQRQVLDVILSAYSVLTSMMKPGRKMSEIVAKAHELEEKSGLRTKFEESDVSRSDSTPRNCNFIFRTSLSRIAGRRIEGKHVFRIRADGSHPGFWDCCDRRHYSRNEPRSRVPNTLRASPLVDGRSELK